MGGPRRIVGILAVASLLVITGCGTKPSGVVSRPFSGQSVRLGILGETDAAGSDEGYGQAGALIVPISAQRGEWEANQSTKVEVRPEPLSLSQAASAVDVLAFRADRLGDLMATGTLAAVPDRTVLPPATAEESESAPKDRASKTSDDPVQFADILPAYRDQIDRYGPDLVALPLGGSALVLVYRRDVFDRPENRDAASAAGIKLALPTTYAELDALAKFFHGRDWDGDGQLNSGIALALGADPDGVAAATFLARAAVAALHPDQFGYLFDDETMEPWITRPPFVEALNALKGLVASGPEGMASFDAEKAREAFRTGKVALLIDRAERAVRWTDVKQPVASGVATLPGSNRVFDPDRKAWQDLPTPNHPSYLMDGGGWLVGVSSRTQGVRKDAALSLLGYLAGKDASSRLVANRDVPLLPVRTSQLGNGLPNARFAPGVDVRAWNRAVSATMTSPRIVPPLRLPEVDGYLADLAQACRDAIAQGVPAEAALKKAAEAWSARTERLGRDRQLWHYRRSLNRPTASSEPPAGPAARPAP